MKDTKIKCVVWDLDNTLWEGILQEGDNIVLKEEAAAVIKELDKRGILQSVSSKNDYESAKEKLEEFGLWEYFIYPQINWNRNQKQLKQLQKASISVSIRWPL